MAAHLLVTGEPKLHRAEPRTLRYRLLHTAARITRGHRRTFLRLAQHWPWTSRSPEPSACSASAITRTQDHPGQ